MRKAWLALLALTMLAASASAQVPACSKFSSASGTYFNETQLFAAATGPQLRSSLFIQCLTSSCLFAINFNGGTASLTSGDSVVVNGQYGFFNGASLGSMPQGAVRIVASASSVISAIACPN